MIPNAGEIRKVLKFLQLVRKHIDENCTVKELLTLLCIAVEPGIDQTTLGAHANISRSGISKYIADLSALTSRKIEGPDLVENRIDPMRLNIRLPTLTAKGERVLSKVIADVWG
jgi:DNA-binding MarR family transcriptional regulator